MVHSDSSPGVDLAKAPISFPLKLHKASRCRYPSLLRLLDRRETQLYPLFTFFRSHVPLFSVISCLKLSSSDWSTDIYPLLSLSIGWDDMGVGKLDLSFEGKDNDVLDSEYCRVCALFWDFEIRMPCVTPKA